MDIDEYLNRSRELHSAQPTKWKDRLVYESNTLAFAHKVLLIKRMIAGRKTTYISQMTHLVLITRKLSP